MQHIFPAPPAFNTEKYIKDVNQKKNIFSGFDSFGVGLTDVEEKYIDWKYTRLGKQKIYFDKLSSNQIAEDVYKKFVACGYLPLDYDPVDVNDISKCTNVFIARIPKP